MVDARGWALVAVLCLLGLLCTDGGARPHPAPFVQLPPVSTTTISTQRTEDDGTPSVTVSGTVLTRAGSPVSGASVMLRVVVDEGCEGCESRLTTGLTAADGRFALLVPAGRYVIACATQDQRPCRAAGRGRGLLDLTASVADVRLTAASRIHYPHPR